MDTKNDRQMVEPTKSELEILQVLWETGPATVRTVNDELLKQKDVNYSTTLKFMQIMTEKGLLKRDDSQMKHIYSVAEAEEKTKAHLLDKFVDSMYKGSAGKLVMQLLGDKKPSKHELQQIKDLLDKYEE
ncbi:BlaI/MecI/CopY family transcriptional regulator [Mucilaginibacter psychrotolerans]|uniref:BlaI/MecI/CopY family transcriptional regulator n=1 Tax=Mucilaginibacter psychrotolerans TaxID=1524096 RepID=A0A4Y8SDQ0_9SPHI|nr:BlaI/MecI/CopY family transcriptional regulator [Mucilaginibacter psychrotolerans]TFF37233.1 BlaI/MecI/CopY family transcriptional regulator [Mucilaginibacter psychrotolerans]